LLKSGQRRSESGQTLIDPFRMKPAQRVSEPREGMWKTHGSDREGCRNREPEPENTRAQGVPIAEARIHGRPHRSNENQRKQPNATVEKDNGRRERARARHRRRICNADDVATDVARQEIIEKVRDEERRGQRSEAEVEMLGFEEKRPSPCTDERHTEI
jgi:hypothetical protein